MLHSIITSNHLNMPVVKIAMGIIIITITKNTETVHNGTVIFVPHSLHSIHLAGPKNNLVIFLMVFFPHDGHCCIMKPPVTTYFTIKFFYYFFLYCLYAAT